MTSALVEKLILDNFIVVFSKSYCPYCVTAKRLLTSLKQEFLAVELDQRDDGNDIQTYLHKKTGQRTVPNIFINQKHIGGCSDLQELVRLFLGILSELLMIL